MRVKSTLRTVWHVSCPSFPDGPDPEMEWDGFSMADISGLICKACGLHIYVEEEFEQEVPNEHNQ